MLCEGVGRGRFGLIWLGEGFLLFLSVKIKDIKQKIAALVKVGLKKTDVTMQDKLTREFINGYNRAIYDALIQIENLKNEKPNDEVR